MSCQKRNCEQKTIPNGKYCEYHRSAPRKKCPHGKRKARCKECGGGSLCSHGIRKALCRDCDGTGYCEHGPRKERCVICLGPAYCKHLKLRTHCVECGGSALCIHNKQKAQCLECDGSTFCEHQILKAQCLECGGSGLCEHNILRRYCVKCDGSAFCVHKKYKRSCKQCDGSDLCKSLLCETRKSNKRYEGYCFSCYMELFPDTIPVRNFKIKEKEVVNRIKEEFPHIPWVWDKAIDTKGSGRRPDLLADMGTHILIIEIDEDDAHNGYDDDDEKRRISEIHEDLSFRPTVFIRINPDGYKTSDMTKVKSCWSVDKDTGILCMPNSNLEEWELRIESLFGKVYYWIDNVPEKIDIVYLYYNEC